jgi:hypothetical protein
MWRGCHVWFLSYSFLCIHCLLCNVSWLEDRSLETPLTFQRFVSREDSGTTLFYSLTVNKAPSRNEFRLLTQNLATMWAQVAKHIRSSTYITNTSSLTRSSWTFETDVDYISRLEIFQRIPTHYTKHQFLCDIATIPPGGRFYFCLQLTHVIATPRRRTLTVVFQRAWRKKHLIPDLG